MSLARIFTIARNVFHEVVRDRILWIIGFYVLLLVAAMQILPQIAGATDEKMILDFGLAAMRVLGLIVAIFIGTGLVNKEIEKPFGCLDTIRNPDLIGWSNIFKLKVSSLQ